MITVTTSEIKCRCCGEPMEARSRAESVQTNSAGATRIIPASTALTCKNAACALNDYTFEASTYAGENLSVYGASEVA
jgi:hypothetical protein